MIWFLRAETKAFNTGPLGDLLSDDQQSGSL